MKVAKDLVFGRDSGHVKLLVRLLRDVEVQCLLEVTD